MTTASARPAFDDALRHYAATLGFPSLSSYIIWCLWMEREDLQHD